MSTGAHITAASSWPAGAGTPASCHAFGTLEMPNSACALRGDLPEDVSWYLLTPASAAQAWVRPFPELPT